MAKIYKVVVAALIPFSFAAAQQTITLNDGTQFQGRYAGGTPDMLTFVDQTGERHHFGVNQVQSLIFSAPQNYSNAAPPAYPSYQAPAPQAYNNNVPPPAQPNYAYNQAPPPPPQQTAYATLPVNTQIAVRTAEGIHASTASPGRTYPATIDQDVVDANGNPVIPRGSNALLVVRDMGNNQIVLDLQSVNVNGQRYALNTMDVTQTGQSRQGLGANGRTGAYVGGGAVLGTLLGAIAGGGRGAAIGALAGAAAGAGTEVLTKGSEVRVPAETVLTFQLDQPVSLYQ
jgi:hypothetical protein